MVASSYVLVESLTLIQNRLGMETVHDFQESFVPLFQVVWVTEALHQMGIAALLAADRRRFSLVDCVSFIVCCRGSLIRYLPSTCTLPTKVSPV